MAPRLLDLESTAIAHLCSSSKSSLSCAVGGVRPPHADLHWYAQPKLSFLLKWIAIQLLTFIFEHILYFISTLSGLRVPEKAILGSAWSLPYEYSKYMMSARVTHMTKKLQKEFSTEACLKPRDTKGTRESSRLDLKKHWKNMKEHTWRASVMQTGTKDQYNRLTCI